jgi:hypothetical protein
MPTGRHSFKHNDAARLIRATKAAGLTVKGVTLDKGKVTLLVDEAAPADEAAKPNPLDRVLDHAQD